MQRLMMEYLNELKKRQKKNRKAGVAAIVLVVFVVGGIISGLTEAGVAMTGSAKCGTEEHRHEAACYENALICGQEEGGGHQHTESCYHMESILVCGQEESEEHAHSEECYQAAETQVCGQEEAAGHIHSESCYENLEVCGQEEHVHTDVCFIDENAGVEDASVWDAQYAGTEWEDVWNRDLVTAARKQLGYEENTDNYVVEEDGRHKGYTRFGQFAGNGYMDWDAAFVNFCVFYAGMAESALFPEEEDSAKWIDEFVKIREENGTCLAGTKEYTPKPGDIIFFQREQEETAAQMGIVSSYNKERNEIQVIEGNSENMVKENTYSAEDDTITNCLDMEELEASYKNIEPENIETEIEEEENAANQEEVMPEDAAEESGISDAIQKETDTESPGMKRGKSAGNVMGPDEAYVDSISITGMTTGTAPFDETEGRGNDTSANDKIVRTYDAVTYNFTVQMNPWDNTKTYDDARVKLEFVLPRTEGEAVFDQSAMSWMDTTEGYAPVITTETREIDGEEKECQVLTCYKHLLPAEGSLSVVPGSFGNNLTVYVKSMHNGETFAPMISAAMEGGTWEGECEKEEHRTDGGKPVMEKKTAPAEPVTVTAAPKYNIQLDSESSYRGVFDFQGDEAWMEQYGNVAANTDIGTPIPGRMMKLGITLQLYNDNPAKGLKGIELPEGPISFDLNVSSAYSPTSGSEQGEQFDTTKDYMPLLWSYGENRYVEYGESNTDGRTLYDKSGCLELAPYFEHDENREGSDCKDSGNWTAKQDGSKIHITVSDYAIDLEHMPTKNLTGGAELYGDHIGCFSAGAIWLVQPFNKQDSETGSEGPEYDVIKEHGPGAFATTATASNLQATTITGEKVEEGKDGFKQMVETDDSEVRTLELNLPGAMQNRIRYAGDRNNWWFGSGVEDIYDGNDYAATGSELYLAGGFSYDSKKDERNQLYLGTNLIRFYGTAIELTGEGNSNLTDGASLNGNTGNGIQYWWEEDKTKEKNIRVFYAAKADGTDWKDDWELQHTLEEDLEFYKSLAEIPDGKLCVGILTCFVGPGPEPEQDLDSGSYYYYHQAKVRDDAKLVGDSFALVSTSRVWTKEMFENAGVRLDSIGMNTAEEKNVQKWLLDSELWKDTNHYKSANIKDSVYYIRETYKEDGSGPVGTHNSEWEHWGDTLLVIGYKTSITKNLMQKVGGEEKKTYNLDTGQRVADFKLQPKTVYEKEGDYDHKDTVTIVDILPEYMTYKEGSAYFGGEYKQTSDEGGKQGEVVAGTGNFPEPVQTEPQIQNNPNGTQTLTWVIEHVNIGEPMAPIYYSANIGDSERPELDVPFGTTNMKNVAYITAPGDQRDPLATADKHSEAGIAVTRGSADSFGKYAKQDVVDEDDAIDYVVYFDNNAETNAHLAIMDTMPMDQVSGSTFIGTYTFAGWKLDTEKCDADKIKIYYTFDKKYAGKTTKTVKEEEIATWTEAEIGQDGSIELPKLPEAEEDSGEEELKHPVAWAVVGDLAKGQRVYIELKINLDPGSSAADRDKDQYNYFVNLLSSGGTTTTTKTPAVRRTLEGLTWIDDNEDGIQDEGEMRLSGVCVELLKLTDGEYRPVCYPDTDEPIVIQTGQQISVRAENASAASSYQEAPGGYKFTDLKEGTYAVRFTEGNIGILKASPVNRGENDTVDSDGVPAYSQDGKVLQKTSIEEMKMPTAEEIADSGVLLYESKYNDSGFYCDTALDMKKNGAEGVTLANVRFKLSDYNGKELWFRKSGSSYSVIQSENSTFREWKLTVDEEGNYEFVGTGDPFQRLELLERMRLAEGDSAQTGWHEGNDRIFNSLAAGGQFVETNGQGKIKINGLLPGRYTVSEIQTAAGYQLLEKPIKIQIHPDGTVSADEMDDVSLDVNGELFVTNHLLYELPSTGGSGIYWYMFSGMLLMMTAALITYRKKRREVLGS